MKKGYIQGLITGVLIAAFIACGIFCGDRVVKKAEQARIQKDIEDTVKAANEKSGDDESSDTSDKKQSEDKTKGKSKGKSNSKSKAESENVSKSKPVEYVLGDDQVIAKIMTLEETINEYYIDDVTKQDIEEGIYNGIMESLGDPYAEYYSVEELKKLQEDTSGKFCGIGARLIENPDVLYPEIVGVFDKSPAKKAKLMEGDYIYKVNGEDVYDMDLDSVVAKIKGEEGSTVTLTIARTTTGDVFDVELVRKEIEVPTVEFKMLDKDIAYIQISQFDTVTSDQFKEAMAEAEGKNMKGLILDLRGNPGGSVGAVVSVADRILPKGIIVYTEDKYGQKEEYTSSGKNEIHIPMVVLVDGGSASASEILAGAIKDYNKGTIMGTTTFGKGIVQQVIPFTDGSAIKLTVSHYYTPNGNDIHKVGIEPDEVVEFDADAYLKDESDNQLDAAIDYLKKDK